MKYVLAHYQGDWTWVKEYTDDYLIYNRSEEDIPGSIKRENIGNADYDKLTYIVDNYHNLPEVFLWSKSNLLDKFITKEEFDKVKDNKDFTPLLTQNHRTYSDDRGVVNFYRDGLYWERSDSWYLNSHPAEHFKSYAEFAHEFHLPNPPYLAFAPGGSYILTKERIHRYGVDYYDRLRSILPYCRTPGEAHMCERSYYNIWK